MAPVTAIALPYPVRVSLGALDTVGDVVRGIGPRARVVVITDSDVGALYAERAAELLGLEMSAVLTIPPGEQYKTRRTWHELTDQMLVRQLGRDTVVVALGGGVIGDIAGFVAATYMRGVPVVHVPTTLLAMVDASIGGKTGVDTPAGKNLVGVFHQPSAVVIDPKLLTTLPIEQLRAGFSEILKHGVVADADYFQRASAFVEGGQLGNPAALPELTALIARSVAIKAAVVSRDERESELRKVLNFGHTIGHAIEAATDFGSLHGEAVAIGLVAEARIAECLGVATSGTAQTIERACKAAGLPTSLPAIPLDTLIGFTRSDKKVRAGRVEYALPKRIGEMAGSDQGWTIPVDDSIVRAALQ